MDYYKYVIIKGIGRIQRDVKYLTIADWLNVKLLTIGRKSIYLKDLSCYIMLIINDLTTYIKIVFISCLHIAYTLLYYI
jgi:hypothetical protein